MEEEINQLLLFILNFLDEEINSTYLFFLGGVIALTYNSFFEDPSDLYSKGKNVLIASTLSFFTYPLAKKMREHWNNEEQNNDGRDRELDEIIRNAPMDLL